MNKNTIKGLIYGAFIGDAIALGPHWIYDTSKIQQHFAPISGYTDPRHTNFHPNKSAGDFTHYGDQALLLLKSIAKHKDFHIDAFKKEWITLMTNSDIYVDAASKESLKRLQDSNRGSDSDELGGFARSAPLFALEDIQEEDILDQIRLTHTDPQLLTIARYLIRVLKDVLHGASIETSLLSHKDIDPFIAQSYNEARIRPDNIVERIKAIGQNCHSPFALPAVLTIALNEETLESALIQNTYAGGDSAARGMVLGMLYGARDGYHELPKDWVHGLNSFKTLEESLNQVLL